MLSVVKFRSKNYNERRNKLKRILLIAPTEPWVGTKHSRKFSFLGTKTLQPPLHLATIAALTPGDINVQIWDETIQGPIEKHADTNNYDLVGITGYSFNIPRAKKIAAIFRKRKIPVVIGGPGVSTEPERCRGYFDAIFIGEAELSWPQFIADWKSGAYRKEYRQIVKPDLAHSPPPKWDSITSQMKNYLAGSVQTTRGCPFACEFCDIAYLYGRKSRHKPIDTILEEVSTLKRLGMDRIFFNDDNFIGSPSYAKKLLQKLIPLNNSFKKPLIFGTQVSLNVARDEQLLELLADANFNMLLIGIETVNKESLQETNKLQNISDDLVADCIKVQSYGMYIKATMIVGFDHDDISIFDRQFEFLQQAHIPVFNLNQLKAPIGTKLWRRLLREGRLLKAEIPQNEDNLAMLSAITNIIPKMMTRTQLISGTVDLAEKLSAWENFADRMKGYISGVKRVPQVVFKRRKNSLKMIFQVLGLMMLVDKETRRAVFDIIFYAKRHAPFLMDRVLGATSLNYLSYYMSRMTKENLQELIELEKNLEIEEFIDHSQVIVPKSFEASYKDIYPEIHQKIKSGLNDEAQTDEALVEVFTSFFMQIGKTLDQFTECHTAVLHDLSDRIVTQINDKNGNNSPCPNKSEISCGNHHGSPEDILQIVEQNLRVPEIAINSN